MGEAKSSGHPSAVRRLRDVKGWHLSTDVVVVGFGAAGASAAIEAAAAGAEVLVLERAGGGGGTSANSGGLIYLGGGTPVQRACGFDDSPEDMFAFLMAACGPGADEAKVRLFCERSVEHFHWLEAEGVPFKRSFYPEPGTEPPTDDCLLYSGGEDAHPFDEIARPAPRAHKPRAPGAAGALLMQKLLAAAERRPGVRTETNTRVATLVVDDDRRVVGVVARQLGEEILVRAARGVILTAGGFIRNAEMVARYAPLLALCNYPLGVDGDDGSGICMGMGAGGAAIRMETASVSIPLYPPKRLMKGILVNRQGQRFINEDSYYGRSGQVALYEQHGRAFLIVDAETYLVNHAGMRAMAVEETVEELEAALALPAGSLESTLALYNRHAMNGKDPLFHKAAELTVPLTAAPFGAIGCSVDDAIYAAFTLGGLHTRPGGEVLTPDGDVVPRLYAAGRTTSGIAAHGYCSGVSLADATFFGRKAGRSAARNRE
jgi:succinate dehydrogenase/fumarate reductase flavoprotein subunit